MTGGAIPEFYFSELDSTMNRAREIAARGDSMVDLFRVRAAHQTAGRGRRGSRWFDLPGNAVMMTMAVRRGGSYDPGDANPGTLALRAGAALLAAIHHFLPPGEQSRIQIKWPNDILLDEGKLAGILVEADPRWFYVGFGVNAFPPESRENKLYAEEVRSVESRNRSAGAPARPYMPAPATLRSLSGMPEESPFLRYFDDSFVTMLHENRWWDVVTGHLAWRGDMVTVSDGGHDTPEHVQDVSGVLAGVSADGAARILRDGAEIICYAGTLRRCT